MSLSTSNSKKFLKKWSLFLGIFCLIFFLVEMTSRWVLQKFFYGTLFFPQSITLFEDTSPEIQVLFCGDSETYYGINPQEIQSSQKMHNFAFPAEGIIATYYKLQYYLKKNQLPKLHTLVLQFQSHSFDREKRFLMRGYGSYSRFLSKIDIWKIYGLKESVLQTLFESYFFHYRKLLSPQSLVGAWKQRNKPLTEKIISNGYGECYGQIPLATIQKEAISKMLEIHKMDTDLVAYYQKIIQMTQEYNIAVYLMQLPTYTDIYAFTIDTPHSKQYKKWRKLEATSQLLTQQFSTLKAISPPISLFSIQHFRDTAHFNIAGAKIMAQWLTEEFQKNPKLR